MSSPMPPKPLACDDAATPIRAAVTAVAERSFYAVADACEDPANEASPSNLWLLAIIRFDDGHTTGSLACWVPPDLAHSLFDAFSGRDPNDQAPEPHHLNDLVGEFSNMVCGDWLSRFSAQRAFQLSPPLVVRAPRPAVYGPRRVWMKVNERPLAIDWDLAPTVVAIEHLG